MLLRAVRVLRLPTQPAHCRRRSDAAAAATGRIRPTGACEGFRIITDYHINKPD